MTFTQKIKNILEPYWTNDFTIEDFSCITKIKTLFKDCGIDYTINTYCDFKNDYKITYYVLSWIEDNKLQTFDLAIEEYYDNGYDNEEQEEINNVN